MNIDFQCEIQTGSPFVKWKLQQRYQVSHGRPLETSHSAEEKKLESMRGIYNAWAASLPPRVTLNSGKLITID